MIRFGAARVLAIKSGVWQFSVSAGLVLVLALGGFASVSARAEGLPGLGMVDPRRAVEIGDEPWQALGRVQIAGGDRCTGVMIGPRQVLTAGHCLFKPAPGHFVRAQDVHFLLGYDRGQYVGHSIASQYRLGPGYDPRRQTQTGGADWAVLTLVDALGLPTHFLAISKKDVASGDVVTLGGYGQDRNEVIIADPACHIIGWGMDGEGRAIMLHNCNATRGTSGAPLLHRTAMGRWEIVGLQFAGLVGGAGGDAIPARMLIPEMALLPP